MHNWLRITLLAVCMATGIAVALAVAVSKPISEPTTTQTESRWIIAGAEKPVSSEPAAPPTPAPVIAPYRDPIAQQVGQLEETLQQIQESSQRRDRSMLRAIGEIQNLVLEAPRPTTQTAEPAGAPSRNAGEPLTPHSVAQDALSGTAVTQPNLVKQAETLSDVRRGEGDDNLTINIQNSDIRAVLETISRETGLNIIASKNVTGTVTANLNGVDIETALAAILKSTGYVAAREGSIIFVGSPTDLAAMNQTQDRIDTRIYRPNYVKAADLQVLFTPLLSTDGKITVSTASQIDIPSDQQKTGGNNFAGIDTVIVRDYQTVLAQLDEIFAEVDVKPRQVAIEAMILSVKLNDEFKFGVNIRTLLNNNNVSVQSVTQPLLGAPIEGLRVSYLDASLDLLIDCLEKVGDTNVVASPRLMCLNKQRAEIQIGEELGYVSTTVTESSATQTINFLSVGTLLRMRPFIGNDGLIRLEVHPELSTGSVEVEQGLSLPQKAVTQVTTNVMCPDGGTIVIGGLIREDLTETRTQIPILGNVPYIGWLFRERKEGVNRNEIIVVITPRIVSEPYMCQEGQKVGNEFTQRQSVYFDKMSFAGKRNLGLHHLRLARAAFNAGDQLTAMKQVNTSIHYDPLNRDAIILRNEILAAGGFEDESIHEYLHLGLGPFTGKHHNYSKQGYPWKEFEGISPPGIQTTDDPGLIGNMRTIVRPAPQPHNPFDPSGPPVMRPPTSAEPLPAVTPTQTRITEP